MTTFVLPLLLIVFGSLAIDDDSTYFGVLAIVSAVAFMLDD